MKKKVNKKPQQFPNIFRFIPENKFVKKIAVSDVLLTIFSLASVVVSVIVITLTIVVLTAFYRNILALYDLTGVRGQIISKANFWSAISNKYDGYKDAYFQLAVNEYKLKNYSLAKSANEKALLLDPNFSDAKKLEELLKYR